MSETWVVMKFGGTSVAGLKQWGRIAKLVEGRQADGHRVCVVCSAIAGVTNELTELSRDHSSRRIESILDSHRHLALELEVGFDDLDASVRTALSHIRSRRDVSPPEQLQASYLALGEWLSTKLGERFLSRQMESTWVDVREILEAEPDNNLSPARRWLSGRCRIGADNAVIQRWGKGPGVVVTQGFIAGNGQGDTVLLGRGGSDTSAALLAGRLRAQRVEIWTDVPGLFSADPRRIPAARLLHRIGYGEALEMAASGARVVHPRSIAAAAEAEIPMHILEASSPGIPGTRIGANYSSQSSSNNINTSGEERHGARAIVEQPGMVVLLLRNRDMRYQIGFLARVFTVFQQHSVSIDLVATSETTTTVAINKAVNHLGTDSLTNLVDDLVSICTVKMYDPCTCINIVGRGVRTSLAHMQNALGFFKSHQLLMLSQSANDLCLSILVNEADAGELLELAHSSLIPEKGSDAVFGERWSELKALT
jgi:diaminopimelate decarboxylase/aspartate kinase